MKREIVEDCIFLLLLMLLLILLLLSVFLWFHIFRKAKTFVEKDSTFECFKWSHSIWIVCTFSDKHPNELNHLSDCWAWNTILNCFQRHIFSSSDSHRKCIHTYIHRHSIHLFHSRLNSLRWFCFSANASNWNEKKLCVKFNWYFNVTSFILSLQAPTIFLINQFLLCREITDDNTQSYVRQWCPSDDNKKVKIIYSNNTNEKNEWIKHQQQQMRATANFG